MFDIGWSELLIIGVVALIVVGPKELPVLLRTVGRYVGMIKKQAAEFRAQFDEAMRETEIEQMRKEAESIGQDVSGALRDARGHLDDGIRAAEADLAKTDGEPTGSLTTLDPGAIADESGQRPAPAGAPPADTSPAAMAARAAEAGTHDGLNGNAARLNGAHETPAGPIDTASTDRASGKAAG